MGYYGMDTMTDRFFFGGGFEIVFFLIFGIIVAVIVAGVVGNMRRWNKNNHSPRLTVQAAVVAKRTDVRHFRGNNSMHTSATSTDYYATFQVESGDRMELAITGEEFGLLAEGDRGVLTFQGTRYLGFQRTKEM